MANARAIKLVDAGSGVGVLQEFVDGDALDLAGAVNEAAAVTLASASTVAIGAAAANTINVSGSNTVNAFDVAPSGVTRRLVFGGSLTLTHNTASLILPTAASIVTAAGDTAEFISLGSGNWRCAWYQRADGKALAFVPYYETTVAWTLGGSITITHGLGVVPKRVEFEVVAKVAINLLAIGQAEELGGTYVPYGVATTQYGVAAGRKTTSNLIVGVGNGGLVSTNSSGTMGAVSPSQGDLKVKVWGA